MPANSVATALLSVLAETVKDWVGRFPKEEVRVRCGCERELGEREREGKRRKGERERV